MLAERDRQLPPRLQRLVVFPQTAHRTAQHFSRVYPHDDDHPRLDVRGPADAIAVRRNST